MKFLETNLRKYNLIIILMFSSWLFLGSIEELGPSEKNGNHLFKNNLVIYVRF